MKKAFNSDDNLLFGTVIESRIKLLHYSTRKRQHVVDILNSFCSSDTRQSMKRQITTER